MTFDDWRDAVDRSLSTSGAAVRTSAFDLATLQSMHGAAVSPVLAARQLIANPPQPQNAPSPGMQPTVAYHVAPSYVEPWTMASPSLMRKMAAVIMGWAFFVAFVSVVGLLFVFLGSFLTVGSVALRPLMALGAMPFVASLIVSAIFGAFGQIVLVAVEALERIRRP